MDPTCCLTSCLCSHRIKCLINDWKTPLIIEEKTLRWNTAWGILPSRGGKECSGCQYGHALCMVTTSRGLTLVVLLPLFSLEGPGEGEALVGWLSCVVFKDRMTWSASQSSIRMMDHDVETSIEAYLGWALDWYQGDVGWTGFAVFCIWLRCSIIDDIHQISDLESYVKGKVCLRGD